MLRNRCQRLLLQLLICRPWGGGHDLLVAPTEDDDNDEHDDEDDDYSDHDADNGAGGDRDFLGLFWLGFERLDGGLG